MLNTSKYPKRNQKGWDESLICPRPRPLSPNYQQAQNSAWKHAPWTAGLQNQSSDYEYMDNIYIYIECSLDVHCHCRCMCIACSSHVQGMVIEFSSHVHCMFVAYSLVIVGWYCLHVLQTSRCAILMCFLRHEQSQCGHCQAMPPNRNLDTEKTFGIWV